MHRKELLSFVIALIFFFGLGYGYHQLSAKLDETQLSYNTIAKVILALLALIFSLSISMLTIQKIFKSPESKKKFLFYFLIVAIFSAVLLGIGYLFESEQFKRIGIEALHFIQGPMLFILYVLGLKILKR